MNKTEYRVIAKIIKQLSLFMLLHGVKDCKIEYHVHQKTVEFKLQVSNLNEELLNRMTEKISKQRAIEVETYGWELMGDTDSQSELDILGSLIDEIDVETSDNITYITLKRRHSTTVK